MQEIINGVSYDTKKAVLLESIDSGLKKDDIRWSVTTLFRTREGKYFLYGIGGPGSHYANKDDIYVYTEGEMIIPMSLHKVVDWVEEHLTDEKLEIILKDIEKRQKRLGLEVPANLKTSLRRLDKRKINDKFAVAKKAKGSQKTFRTTYAYW